MIDNIYILIDPRSGEPRYVGKTQGSIEKRLTVHMQPAGRKKETYKNHWLNQLVELGLKPTVELLEKSSNGSEAEIFWIEYLTSLGYSLTNGTVGGDGRRKGSKMTDVARANMSKAHVGIKMPTFSKEHCERIRISKTGVIPGTETREKMSRAHKKARPFMDQYGRIYECAVDAVKAHGLNGGNVHHVLNRHPRHSNTKGFVFRYLDEDILTDQSFFYQDLQEIR